MADAQRIAESRLTAEVNTFFTTLAPDKEEALYGIRHVRQGRRLSASDAGTVATSKSVAPGTMSLERTPSHESAKGISPQASAASAPGPSNEKAKSSIWAQKSMEIAPFGNRPFG